VFRKRFEKNEKPPAGKFVFHVFFIFKIKNASRAQRAKRISLRVWGAGNTRIEIGPRTYGYSSGEWKT